MVVKTEAVDCGAREVDRSGPGCPPWRGLLFLDAEFSATVARHLFTEHVIEYIFCCYPKGINATNMKNFFRALQKGRIG